MKRINHCVAALLPFFLFACTSTLSEEVPSRQAKGVELLPSFHIAQDEAHSITHAPIVLASANDNEVIVGTNTGEMVIFDSATRAQKLRKKVAEGFISGSLAGDGAWMVALTVDGQLIVTDTRSGEVLNRQRMPGVRHLAVSDGHHDCQRRECWIGFSRRPHWDHCQRHCRQYGSGRYAMADLSEQFDCPHRRRVFRVFPPGRVAFVFSSAVKNSPHGGHRRAA